MKGLNQFLNEAKINNDTLFRDVESMKDLEAFLRKKFKKSTNADYDFEVKGNELWLWYDVVTKKGYSNAKGNMVIDLPSKTLYGRDGSRMIQSGFDGPYDDLFFLVDLIKEYIKDDKKTITG